MRQAPEIQDIEEMRRQEGIDDIDLRVGIRALKVGDVVKISLITGASTFETLQVRITSIRESAFRGKLADGQTCTRRSRQWSGKPLAFTTAHIHSIAKKGIHR
jgi:hypothetical protein